MFTKVQETIAVDSNPPLSATSSLGGQVQQSGTGRDFRQCFPRSSPPGRLPQTGQPGVAGKQVVLPLQFQFVPFVRQRKIAPCWKPSPNNSPPGNRWRLTRWPVPLNN